MITQSTIAKITTEPLRKEGSQTVSVWFTEGKTEMIWSSVNQTETVWLPSFLSVLSISVVFILLVSGCSVGPKYEPPVMELAEEWHQPLAEGMSLEEPCSVLWWESLNDPMLNSLLSRAALSNLDLAIAAMRILESRAEEKGGYAALLPHLDASGTYGHIQYNQSTLNHILGTESKHHSHHRQVNFFEAGFDAEWEIDLFGMRAHDICALKAKTDATREEFYHLWVTLSAEIARHYIGLRGLQYSLQLLDKNIQSQTETLVLTQDLIQAGFADSIDQRQVEEQLSILAAKKPGIQLAIDKAIYHISILLGQAPGELYAELCEPAALPTLPCERPIGIPSELLRRRPDIRKAERELAAATENVGSAIAALFPRLSLRGFIGDIGNFHSNSFTWFAGPQLLQPLFNSKLLQQDVCINQIRAEQALYNYQKTVLSALEETENAIASFHSGLKKDALLSHALQRSKEVYDLSVELYQKGLKDYLEVLVNYRSFLANQDAYQQNQVELLVDYVILYKALAGSWEIAYTKNDRM